MKEVGNRRGSVILEFPLYITYVFILIYVYNVYIMLYNILYNIFIVLVVH